MFAVLRRLPMLLILVAGMSAIFLIYSIDHEKQVLKDMYAERDLQRVFLLTTYTQTAKVLGAKGMWDELEVQLEQARSSGQIDFYVLQSQGHVLWFGNETNSVEQVDVKFPVAPTTLATPQIWFQSTVVGDYQFTVGIQKNFDKYLSQNKTAFQLSIWQNAIYVFLIVLAVGFWTLKDISLMVREIRKGKRGRVGSIQARSAESQLFLQGLTGYAKAVSDLESENVRLGRQVLPSLQKEIHSGRKPPYDFNCTMVRTDINHFSTIFNTHNVTEFMATINEFFDEVSRIVARYGGLIHEFVGDEVIYYFKDDEHANSFAIAMSAIRDINVLASQVHESTMKERGYPFTVKSSAAHGKVRFGPLVGGFTIAGAVLIETVRVLTFITEKDENVIYFDGRNAPRLAGLIQSSERMQVKMKGYQSEVILHQYAAHLPLRHVLETLSENSVEQLFYYRSDEDLITILNFLRAHACDEKTVLKAIRAMREPYVARPSRLASPALRDWINDLLRREDQAKILSAAVKLYINLVPREEFIEDDKILLSTLLSHADRRVVANTVEVLTHFSADSKTTVRNIRDDLRIHANAIVHDGRDEMSGVVMKRLKALLKSKKASELASGLYALGELASIHRAKDFAYFSAHVEFQSLLSQIDVHASHTTTLVRRQALIAARKAGDESVISKIRHHVRDSGSELLAEEVRRYLDTEYSSAA